MLLDLIFGGVLYSCLTNFIHANRVNESVIHLCSSIDIGFFNFDEIYHYRDCSVIEGFVRIDSVSLSDKQKDSVVFPKLKEISGYLLLSRVSGLTSLHQVFPVLSVIRGNVLFHDYAFIIFEMLNLEELGLVSLSNILKGGVFVAKNPALCFVDSIDWSSIAKNNFREHIYRNKIVEECPKCPDSCPKIKANNKPLCWKMNSCQKICEHCSYGCNDNNICCDKSCIGGCSGITQNDCTSCKDVFLNGTCMEKCPDPFYDYQNRRCITKNECHSVSNSSDPRIHWKPHEGECLHECPSGYFEKEEIPGNFVCKKCENGKCGRECKPRKMISSKEDIESLKGCKYIKGPLIINLSGDYMIELEHNLNEIEVIRDYLAVKDSYHITSFNFLKNLKEIRGEYRDNNYTLEVFANKNLEFLWDWEHKNGKLKINGSVLFHSNPKLCLSNIKELITMSENINVNESSVSNHTNGVQAVCLITELKVNITHIEDKKVILQWSPFNYHDPRILLGYKVHYKEAIHNVTIYDERSVCGKDDWVVVDIKGSQNNATLENFRPFTRYAIFVRTSTILADKDEQSQLQYFMTEPSTPSIPRNLKLFPTNHSSIHVSWESPAHPNGNISSYLVSVYLESFIFDNHSCSQENEVDLNIARLNNIFITEESKVEEKYHIYIPGKSSKMNAPEKRNYEVSKIIANSFENKLMNCVFIKTTKKKRSISNLLDSSTLVAQKTVKPTNANFDKLKHFTPYRVVVQACQEDRCGNKTARILFTLSHPDADKLNDSYPFITMSNRTGTVILSWEKPNLVNGFVKAYIVEYKTVESHSATPICFTEQEFSKTKAFTLSSLSPGNYSIRLRILSSHGLGEFTSWKFIYIPEEPLLYQYIYYIIAAVVIICIFLPLICAAMWFYIYKTGKDKLIISINPEYVTSSYIPDNWEIPRSHVELIKEIGQGSFGMVYEGTLNLDGSSPVRCAVKTVNTQASEREKMEFLNEASVMKAFDTYHVVKLLGVVSQGEPAFVVMELMTSGDLKSFLRSCRPEVAEPHVRPPNLRQLLQMSAEIADGMAYLSAKKYVHRDLAARNCMVSENLTVKIGDFGMARDVYEGDYYRKGSKGLMPVRWMAPESLREGIFLSLSDVWSFGVVLYEMVTLAAQPYQGLSNDQVLRYILDGGIIERPEDCPDKVYILMRKCWRQKPLNRPSFLDIVSYLHEDVSFAFRNVSFYDTDEGKEIRRNLQESCETRPD